MFKKILTMIVLFVMFLHPKVIRAEEYKNIEIFDPKQDKVVKTIPINKEINSMVVDWINSIDEIYVKVDPIKDDGYTIRFPLDPTLQVDNKWLNTTVKEVYLVLPENDPPFFMVFETQSRLVCFPFTGEISKLSSILDFRLE